jgi:hypothetical protein
MGTSSETRLDELMAENARLRKLAELLHDSLCPVESERFPAQGREACRVCSMVAAERDRYWYSAACEALELSISEGEVSEWNSEMNHLFHFGTQSHLPCNSPAGGAELRCGFGSSEYH